MNGRSAAESSAAQRRPFLRRLLRVFTLSVGLGCAAFFVREVRAQWQAIAQISWSVQALCALAAATVVLVLAGLFDGWSWGFSLRCLGIDASSRPAIGVFTVAQFAKYLPGNVGQHLGRLELARRRGWQLGRVGVSLIIENGLALGTGALLAACGLFVLRRGSADGSLVLAACGVTLASVFAALVGRRLLARPPGALKRWLRLEQPIVLSAWVLSGLYAVHIVSHLASAASVALLLAGYGVELGPLYWRLPMIVAVAWLSGYLVPGAPAGLGVRELVLTDMLAPHTGSSAAVSAAIAWRISALCADAILLLIGSSLRAAKTPSAMTT